MKIINTLFGPSYGYIRAILAIAVGLLFVFFPADAEKMLITIIGSILLVVGIVSLVLSLKDSENHVGLMGVNGIFDIIFGLLLIIFPTFFASLLIYLIAALMLVFVIGQIAALAVVRGNGSIPFGFYILPIVLTIGGFVMMFKPDLVGQSLFLIAGIAMLCYGISELFSTIKINRMLKAMQQEVARTSVPENEIEDVPYEDVTGKDGSSEDDSDEDATREDISNKA